MFHNQLSNEGDSLCFKDVLPREIEILRNARVKREVPAREWPLEQDIVGLAFSGGGIRSATFNLGVIQALASKNLLKFVDYLSTVSGGGYIGSWLSSWVYSVSLTSGKNDNHIAQIEAELNRQPKHIGDFAEPPQIHFLRKYSNYLTPRLGALSGDTLAFVGTYIRNLLLNQMILVSALFALLVIPRAVGLVFSHFYDSTTAYVSAILAVLLLLVVALGVALNSHAKPYTPRGVIYFIAVPQFFFCVLTTYALWQLVTADGVVKSWLLPDTLKTGLYVVGSVAITYGILWFLAVSAGLLLEAGIRAEKRPNLYLVFAPALWSLPAGAVAGALLLFASAGLAHGGVKPWSIWYVLTFHVPLVTLLVMLVGVIHLGLIGRAYGDGLREWWARLGGVLLAMTFVWFTVCLLTLFFPMWIERLGYLLTSTDDSWRASAKKILSSMGITGAVAGWVTATLKGLFAAKGAETGPRTQSNGKKDLLAQLAPPIFVFGLILVLSMGLYFLVPAVAGGAAAATYWDVLSSANWWMVVAFGLSAYGLSRFLGYRVDVNEFSLHNAYRNRIVRCYMGATNCNRHPQPFTGFDESDNIFMHGLQEVGAPFHIVNATLNVVKGKELALQSRKARSFAFTPLYSGFDYSENNLGSYRLTENYSRNSRYSGGRLGTAMAISGAAASPNMGHYTTGAVSFLLTIFSVRLGWWLGNPMKQESWESKYPRSSWKALMNELTGTTNEEQDDVYLSDGGHFENLAIYELVRRRCRVIIACDAGADPSCVCNDLASAVEKCRVDFSTRIDIDIKDIRPSLSLFPGDEKLRGSETPFTIGTIHYPDRTQGTLIYIKPSLNTQLPQDVLAYARLAAAFPHQSTLDQFFDEVQFESYRALGFACASAAIDEITRVVQA
jgi:predicted acylesterase/phospholipase RssA